MDGRNCDCCRNSLLFCDAGIGRFREAVKMNTLLGLAQRAVKDGDWEGSARYALLGMKGAEYPWIGFDARTAEDALAGSLLDNRRIGISNSAQQSQFFGRTVESRDVRGGSEQSRDRPGFRHYYYWRTAWNCFRGGGV